MRSITFLLSTLLVGDNDDVELVIREANKQNLRAFIKALIIFIIGVTFIALTADSIIKIIGGCILLVLFAMVSVSWGYMSALYILSKTVRQIRFDVGKGNNNG